jgi:hypothetical protein
MSRVRLKVDIGKVRRAEIFCVADPGDGVVKAWKALSRTRARTWSVFEDQRGLMSSSSATTQRHRVQLHPRVGDPCYSLLEVVASGRA